jgi:hypothetical protein
VPPDAAGSVVQVTCGRSPEECAAESFQPGELGQHVLDEAALVRLLQNLFGTDGKDAPRGPTDRALSLGRSRDGRDVWLWPRPREPEFTLWMREREDLVDPTLVLVPTPARIYAETFDRYGPGQHASIAHLDRTLGIDGGAIVRARLPPSVTRLPWSVAEPTERSAVHFRTPAGTTWRHIAVEQVDGEMVSIRVGEQRPVRASASELGLTSETSGAPNAQWRLLLALCEGSGTCTRGSVGASSVSVLKMRAQRLGDQLCVVFGIPESPLHVTARDETVRSDFIAAPETRRAASRHSW